MDTDSVLSTFHPVIKEWFTGNIGTPSLPQALGWPQIQAGNNVLISAPTGAGKTLAAFLESIDTLLRKGLEGSLPEGVFILYVSPLKALNNDIYKNLDIPLKGIKKCCINAGIPFPDIRKAVRTGDTPQNERVRMIKNPPHILITTPESLYLMLTSKNAINMLKNVRYLIVDEIHTMLGTKRGVHLAISIERLEHLTLHELVRIGLSATVNPLEDAASYLGGFKKSEDGYIKRPVTIVAPVMEHNKDLMIHMPVPDYRVLEQGTIWPEIYDSVFKLIKEHTSTIVFVNNRAVAEKVSANVNSIADFELCRPHHGSMSKSKRLELEDLFKRGELKCIIATSTLELGIDVGSVDLVIQVASPLSVSSGLQRLGRAGHRLSATSKGRIIPKTRGDLVKSAFISREMLEGHIEKEKIPSNCLDILSQHVVSMCCEKKWAENDMLGVIRSAWSYRNLRESDFKKVLSMLAGDFEHMDDIPASPRIYWDREKKTIEGTGYSRMLAINSSGTIPDRGYFPVYLEDAKTRIGELDEVFVFEARLGDRFMLGNSAWKIERIEKNRVMVSQGSTTGAKTPFWQGDGIGSPFEQGTAFGRFLKKLDDMLDSEDLLDYLTSQGVLDETAAINVKNYLSDQKEAVGCLSTDRRIVVEYLKDDVTDQKIIIHAHFGGRVNSVLAVLIQQALEEAIKCQAYASHSNDAILIHLYGCPDTISNVLSLLNRINVEEVLLKTLPATPRFAMTFRYNAFRSLMMGVRNLGQRLPLWIQRLRSVDALENARKYMDHPLIIETMRECMEEIFDIPNTINVLKDIRSGGIEVVEKSTWFPSAFASELLFEFKSFMMYMEKAPHPGAPDYSNNTISGMDALNLSYRSDSLTEININPEAINEISLKNSITSKLSTVHSTNELHSFLLIYGDINQDEIPSDFNKTYLSRLMEENRVLLIHPAPSDSGLYIAAEESELYSGAMGVILNKYISEPYLTAGQDTWTQDDAISRVIRRYARYHSPFDSETVIKRYDFNVNKVSGVFQQMKAENLLVRGHFTDTNKEELCHIKIYESIVHKNSILNSGAVVAKSPSAYASFLPFFQKTGIEVSSSENLLFDVIGQLEGLFLPADWWENIVFPVRIKGYTSGLLDRLCSSGKVFWRANADNDNRSLKIAWYCSSSIDTGSEPPLLPDTFVDAREERVFSALKHRGACFTHNLSHLSGLLPSELLDTLESLVYKGVVVNDSFSSVRLFMERNSVRSKTYIHSSMQAVRKMAMTVSRMDMGRWETAWPVQENDLNKLIDRWLNRYGLLSRDNLSLETTDFSWNQIYESLKVREYAGFILRGYFIEGISGIQFMLPDACSKLGGAAGMQVINACDPAQVYGRVIPRNDELLPFTNIPGTALVLNSGKPVVVFERYGERILFSCGAEELKEAIKAFSDAFREKRIWPERRKISVKNLPEEKAQEESLRSALASAGFKNEILKMILIR